MLIVVFDLDFTLANTEDCQPYLTSQVGRDLVVSHLRQGLVRARSYGADIVAAFNDLRNHPELRGIVVSDSPKAYCLEVLNQCGYSVNPNLVFGAQGKPLVDFEVISESVSEELNIDEGELEYIVVGDSPKDIYFAHSIEVPSIFATWGTRHTLNAANKSRPTSVVNNLAELRSSVRRCREGALNYQPYDFSQNYLTFLADEVEDNEFDVDDIGFGQEYVPHHTNYRNNNDNDKFASRNLNWVVKKAKNYPRRHHTSNTPMQMYGQNGVFETQTLMRQSGHFKRDFLRWCDSQEIYGRILLIPVPASVPQECNLSYPIEIICTWWAGWISSERANMNISVHDVFERFWPRQPSHLSEGRREMYEQFETLGIHINQTSLIAADYIIIIDDVVTSGAHMSAIASLLRTAGMVAEQTEVKAYALFKTVHPENQF